MNSVNTDRCHERRLRFFTKSHLGFSLSCSNSVLLSGLRASPGVCRWFSRSPSSPPSAPETIHCNLILGPPSVHLSSCSSPAQNAFISHSLSNKAPIHCLANQSRHSCSKSSMTRFIWLGLSLSSALFLLHPPSLERPP